MVIYAWAVAQDYFKEMTDQSVREEMYEEDKLGMDEDMAPFGFIDDGITEEIIVEKKSGLVWKGADIDEYGAPMSPWQWESTPYGGNPSWW